MLLSQHSNFIADYIVQIAPMLQIFYVFYMQEIFVFHISDGITWYSCPVLVVDRGLKTVNFSSKEQ